MVAWSIPEVQQNQILAYSLIHGIRYCVHNLFAYKNDFIFMQNTNSEEIKLPCIPEHCYATHFLKKRINDLLTKPKLH